MAEKSQKWPIYYDFSYFTSIISGCYFKSFSCILLKLVMYVNNKQFLNKFNTSSTKIHNGRFIVHFTSVILSCGRDKLKSFFLYPAQKVLGQV